MEGGRPSRVKEMSARLADVAERLDRLGVSWAVFAGAAASVYGTGRQITDVDILVQAAAGDQVVAEFAEGEVRRYPDGTMGIALPGFDLVVLRGLIELDVEMAERLTRHELLGVEVPVVPPEDNMLFKGLLGRGPEEGKHDWADVQAMINSLQSVDWAYLDWRIREMGSKPEGLRVLERLRWMWRERAPGG